MFYLCQPRVRAFGVFASRMIGNSLVGNGLTAHHSQKQQAWVYSSLDADWGNEWKGQGSHAKGCVAPSANDLNVWIGGSPFEYYLNTQFHNCVSEANALARRSSQEDCHLGQ